MTVTAGPLGVHAVRFYPSVGFGMQPRRVSDVFRLCLGPNMLSSYFISAWGLTEWWKEGKRKLDTSGGSAEDTALSLTMPHLLKRHALAEKQRGALALIDLEQMLTQRLFAMKRRHLSQWIQIRLICFFFLPMPKSSNDVFQPGVALLRLIKVRIFARRLNSLDSIYYDVDGRGSGEQTRGDLDSNSAWACLILSPVHKDRLSGPGAN